MQQNMSKLSAYILSHYIITRQLEQRIFTAVG